MRIAIAGTGYVGLSMAVLLAQHNTVTAVDIVPEKADLINRRISPIADSEIQEYLSTRPLDLTATTDGDSAYRNADLVLISTPTNYDPDQNYFDTSSVESVIRQVMAVIMDLRPGQYRAAFGAALKMRRHAAPRRRRRHRGRFSAASIG